MNCYLSRLGEGVSSYPSYGLLDRIEILVLPAQQPESRLEEPFAFGGVGFLVDLGKDRHQLVAFPNQEAVFSAFNRSDPGFAERQTRNSFCLAHLMKNPLKFKMAVKIRHPCVFYQSRTEFKPFEAI
ncbi:MULTISPECIES: hypothetical protein [unclassified Mesorhizobium]|uniref:hypothetical protein n=1 Tax=unclassified Mesorhizobium TaxID=325217 RepID=UPI0012EC2356|nr:hypothetical protein [Mesorhizobium sp. LSJC280B00]